jgi:hypothetical protein
MRPGEQLASTVCSARVVVIRAPAGAEPVLSCGGRPMVPVATAGAAAGGPAPARASAAATLVGKRYTDESGTVEVLCTASGSGELSCDGVPMTLKAAKPLPASD